MARFSLQNSTSTLHAKQRRVNHGCRGNDYRDKSSSSHSIVLVHCLRPVGTAFVDLGNSRSVRQDMKFACRDIKKGCDESLKMLDHIDQELSLQVRGWIGTAD
eukprot:3942944-Amphidinium_carterae.1